MPLPISGGAFFVSMTLIQFQQNATVSSADVRTEQLDGKEWLVAPAVVIVAGVLNGLLVPAAEIEISTMSWNGRSIPVHHPNTNTANEPMTVQNQVIGYFYGANFQTDRLHGEMWFDVAKANSLGGDAAVVIENVQNGGMIEVSTAYWAYTTSQSGEFNGVPYTGITTHILPDHIAVLPGDEGACNVNDGCGVPRKNRSESMDKMTFKNCKGETFGLDLLPLDEKRNCNFHLTKNVAGVSHRETNRALKTAVNFVTDIAGDYWIWVEDVWDDYFVYEIEANGSDAAGYWQRPYTIDANLNVTLGTAARVQPRRIFEPVAESQPAPVMQNQSVFNQVKNYVQNLFQNHEKERQMKDMIAAIIENGKTGLTAEQLKELPETAVTAMFNGLELNEDEDDGSIGGNVPSEPSQPEGDTMPTWAADLAAKFGDLATKVDGLSATQNAAAEQKKAGIIAKLVANERVTFSEDELKAFTVSQLEKLATSFIEPDYSGLFFGENSTGDGYEYVGLTINNKEEAK